MIKKITDEDKEDWENFLNNKKKNLNKNSLKKKEINNQDKYKQNWKKYINNKKKINRKKKIKTESKNGEEIIVSPIVDKIVKIG